MAISFSPPLAATLAEAIHLVMNIVVSLSFSFSFPLSHSHPHHNFLSPCHAPPQASLSDLSNVSAQSETFSAAAAPPSALYITRGAALLAFVGALLVALVGVVGNLSTIVALLKYTCRSSGGWAGLCGVSIEPTTKFVIFLAATDLSFCVVVLPITAVRYLSQSWPFGAFLCQLYPLLYYGTVASSLMFITVITINRYGVV